MIHSERLPLIALAGSPNSGKTALFNALTKSRQKVANYSGVTVEHKEGKLRTASGKTIRVLDLPGLYSLEPQSPDEEISRDVLFNRLEEQDAPDAVVVVVDATNLERHLSLVLELKSVGRPLLVALNMIDLARKRGLDLDLKKLSDELGVPVIPTVAVRNKGISSLVVEAEKLIVKSTSSLPISWKKPSYESVQSRFREVDEILERVSRSRIAPSKWTERLDSVLLHPIYGSLFLVTLMLTIFQAVFNWAAPFQEMIEGGIEFLSLGVTRLVPDGVLQSLLIDGILAGVGGVLVFLPQILILFLFILLLEDLGYMARAAFLMDKLMGSVGLHGRAFLPLLSSFACAIPGIMATRTIQSQRDRLVTILVAPLMTCSARLPVYSLLIAAFIPNSSVWGPLNLQGLVMFGLYFAGILAAVGVAFALKVFVLRGAGAPFILELPTYKVPSWKNVVMGLYERARIFIKRVGTIILSLTIVLWFLASYPKPENVEALEKPPIYYSYAGQLGRGIEPLLSPLGFDWKVSVALIPGMAAREVMVGALSTVYSIEQSQAFEKEVKGGAGAEEAKEAVLGSQLAQTWTLATALSLLVWYIFAPQCLSTLAVVRRETQSWKWPAIMLFYLFVLAYAGSFFTYNVTQWATHAFMGGA